jgi:hypothetical protein
VNTVSALNALFAGPPCEHVRRLSSKILLVCPRCQVCQKFAAFSRGQEQQVDLTSSAGVRSDGEVGIAG